MAEKTFTVLNLLELNLTGHDALELKCIAGKRGLPRKLTVADINRPGLAISGFYENFAFQRVQLFGRGVRLKGYGKRLKRSTRLISTNSITKKIQKQSKNSSNTKFHAAFFHRTDFLLKIF